MRRKLKVIHGTSKDNPKQADRKFISAYATNTRLMGVFGMYIHWKVNDEDQYQLFHFDAEEYGFDNYACIYGENKEKLAIEKEAMMGGLGGKYVSLKESEAIYLFQRFISMNIKNNLPFPEPRGEYTFLYRRKVNLNEHEKNHIMKKICEATTSEYQVINYFLMRAFAKDEEGMKHLSVNDQISLNNGKHPATLLKNSIEESSGQNLSYVCESLIEEKLKYRIEITEIELVDDGKDILVKDAQLRSTLNVSATEAAFMLNRPEYINIYDIDNVSEFVDFLKKRKPNALYNIHTSIHLFTEFNFDNKHVKEKHYMLNGDIYGVYCITETGQLIIAGYTTEKINKIEKYFSKSEFEDYITLIEKLEFKESVLYEFVHSGYDDFFDFLADF